VPAPLAGVFEVDESARLLRHYRYAAERMMRVLGGWIALTPELSAKLLMGRHVWDNAQHCDGFGKRLLELRGHAHGSEPANGVTIRFMDAIERAERPDQTVERLVGVYRVLKPHLLATYEWHLVHANPVYEPPTRRLLERCIQDERRHIAAGETIVLHLASTPALRERAQAWQRALEDLLAAAGGVTGRGLPPPAIVSPSPDAEAEEFIRLEQSRGPRGVPESLEQAMHRFGDAIVGGDRHAVRRAFAAGIEPPAAFEEGGECGRAHHHRIVALARVGRHYMAKVRLEGEDGAVKLLLRWMPVDADWRIGSAEVIGIDSPTPA
jgi:hypothetical protein